MRDSLSEGDLHIRAAGSLERWNDIVGSAFDQCVVDAPHDRFDAELWRGEIGDIGLVRIRAQPSRVSRWLGGAPQMSSGKVLLHLQIEGSSINEQSRQHVHVDAGEAVLCAADQRYSVDFLTPYEMFVVEIPISRILGRIPEFDLDQMAGHKVDARRSQLLIAFLRTAWMQRDCLDEDFDWCDCVSRTSIDLALRAISRSGHVADMPGPSADMRRTALDYIARNLTDPDLRTSTIAQAVGVSPRSISNIFERLATTTSGFILEQRLDAAARALIEDRAGSITSLAFDVGFSDSAYFSRCFRHRYGVSPRDYKRQGGVGAVGRARGDKLPS